MRSKAAELEAVTVSHQSTTTHRGSEAPRIAPQDPRCPPSAFGYPLGES